MLPASVCDRGCWSTVGLDRVMEPLPPVLIDPPHCTLFATIEPVLEFNVTRPLSLLAEIELFTVVADIIPPRSRKTTGALCDCTSMPPSTPLISTEPEVIVTCALACVVSALAPSICTTPDPSVSRVLLPNGTVMFKSILLERDALVSLLAVIVMVLLFGPPSLEVTLIPLKFPVSSYSVAITKTESRGPPIWTCTKPTSFDITTMGS